MQVACTNPAGVRLGMVGGAQSSYIARHAQILTQTIDQSSDFAEPLFYSGLGG